MTRIVPVIQARMASTRFSGKVLALFQGRPLLVWQIACAQTAFPEAQTVCAVPYSDVEGDIGQCARVMGCHVIGGPEDDVLLRFAIVADLLKLQPDDIIVRLTADDPLKEPTLVQLAARLVADGAPYADTNHGHLTGFGAEAFTCTALREADRLERGEDREHVTAGMRRRYPPPMLSVTVDTPEDLARLERWFA